MIRAATLRARGGVGRSLIRRLFGAGEQGAFYVPQPQIWGQQVLFQDAAGTIPVTADGDPVGRMLDLSGNGNHATQSTSASRPVYRTDGTLHWLEFDGVDDWLQVPNSQSTFTFMHDGTGGGVAAAVEFLSGDALQPVVSTGGTATSKTGFVCAREDRSKLDADNGYYIAVQKSVAGVPVARFDVRSSSLNSLTPYVLNVGYTNAGTSDDLVFLSNGALLDQTGTASTPNLNDATDPLSLMRESAFYTHGKLSGAVVREGGLRGTTGDNVDAYLANLAGITL